MAFITTEKEFDRLFGESRSLSLEFLREVRKYLKRRPYLTPFKEVLHAAEEEAGITAFSCRRDLAEDILQKLLACGIPCLMVGTSSGRRGFLVPAGEKAAVLRAQKAVIDMKKKALETDILPGKDVLSREDVKAPFGAVCFSGLSEEEAWLIIEDSLRDVRIMAIGVDRMSDKSYRILLPAKAFTSKQEGPSPAGMALYIKLMLAGPYKGYIRERLSRISDLFRAFPDALSGKGELLIADEEMQYLIVKGGRVEYGKVSLSDGAAKISPEGAFSLSHPDAEKKAYSFLDAMLYPKVLRGFADLQKFYAGESVLKTFQEMSFEESVRKTIDFAEKAVRKTRGMAGRGAYGQESGYDMKSLFELVRGAAIRRLPEGLSHEDAKALLAAAKELQGALKDMAPFFIEAPDGKITRVLPSAPVLKSLSDIEGFARNEKQEMKRRTPTLSPELAKILGDRSGGVS